MLQKSSPNTTDMDAKTVVNIPNQLSTKDTFDPQQVLNQESDLPAPSFDEHYKHSLGGTPKEAIQQYLEFNITLKRINTSELSKLIGVTRQRVSQILDELGEIRHKRTGQIVKICPICDVKITKNANACREHSHKKDNRVEGYKYRCKTCNKFKDLFEFTRSKRSPSGYEHRCLLCRADWQRNYNKTHHGREKHKKIVKALIDKHPERRRAYYKVFKAIKDGVLIKQPCEICSTPKTQAIHTDYTQPLNVRWLCRLCVSRDSTNTVTYTPDELEDQYRKYINSNQNSNNISGKWIAAIQKYYRVSTVNKQTLIESLDNYRNISGLDKKYVELTTQFLNDT